MLSAVIIARDEEKNIERAIHSLIGVTDEIIVVDSGSVDQTIVLAEKLGARVIQSKWLGYSATKNLGNEAAKGEYILSLDADEALSEELKNSILEAKNQGLTGLYSCNRLTSYCGRWIRHCGWYPDRKVRIFPKDQARWVGEFIHETLEVNSNLTESWLPGDLLHYSYHTFAEHRERTNHYAALQAEQLIASGRKKSVMKLLFAPPFKFLKTYLFQQGIRYGWSGVVLSWYSAKGVFLKYKKCLCH